MHQMAKVLGLHHQSFRIDWFDFLGVQGTLKSLLQHHSSKASVHQCSTFIVQHAHPYMTSGKTIALTRQTFVSKVMSLFLNALPRFVIAFLPRSEPLLTSGLQSPSTVILEPSKRKSVIASIFSLSNFQEVIGPDAMILVFCFLGVSGFLNVELKPAFSLSSFTLIKRS